MCVTDELYVCVLISHILELLYVELNMPKKEMFVTVN